MNNNLCPLTNKICDIYDKENECKFLYETKSEITGNDVQRCMAIEAMRKIIQSGW